jgi:hypothetical protein
MLGESLLGVGTEVRLIKIEVDGVQCQLCLPPGVFLRFAAGVFVGLPFRLLGCQSLGFGFAAGVFVGFAAGVFLGFPFRLIFHFFHGLFYDDLPPAASRGCYAKKEGRTQGTGHQQVSPNHKLFSFCLKEVFSSSPLTLPPVFGGNVSERVL